MQRLFETFLVSFNKWRFICQLPSRGAQKRVPIIGCSFSSLFIKLRFLKNSSRGYQYQVSWKSALVLEICIQTDGYGASSRDVFIVALLNNEEKLTYQRCIFVRNDGCMFLLTWMQYISPSRSHQPAAVHSVTTNWSKSSSSLMLKSEIYYFG
jgi:hypothetical protein